MIHYDPEQMSSIVTNDAIIRIVLVLMIMFDWGSYLCNAHGTFSMGKFKGEEELLMEVPRFFKVNILRIYIYCLKKQSTG